MNIFELVTVIRNEQKPLYRLKVGDRFSMTMPNDFSSVVCEPEGERITINTVGATSVTRMFACDETVLVWAPK